jgi:hypothetical protein
VLFLPNGAILKLSCSINIKDTRLRFCSNVVVCGVCKLAVALCTEALYTGDTSVQKRDFFENGPHEIARNSISMIATGSEFLSEAHDMCTYVW